LFARRKKKKIKNDGSKCYCAKPLLHIAFFIQESIVAAHDRCVSQWGIVIMYRSKYAFDEKKIKKFIRDGRGQGKGKDYLPWTCVAEVPSMGRSHRFHSRATGREHHLLSDNEYYAFIELAWNSDVVDLREHFPLRRDETIEIAKDLHVSHPMDRETKVPLVLTTDILVTYRVDGAHQLHAYSIKEDLNARRKKLSNALAIERVYWERREIPWSLLLSSELKTRSNRNLSWMASAQVAQIQVRDYDATTRLVLEEVACRIQKKSILTLAEVCRFIDCHNSLSPGAALLIVRHALGQKQLRVDLDCPSLFELPISRFTLERVL